MERSIRLAGIVALFVVLVGSGAGAGTDDFLIQRGKVGRLSVGMLVTDIWKFYPRASIKGGFLYSEGIPGPVIEIRLPSGQKKPSLIVGLDETKDHRNTVVRGIDARDARFKTVMGIGPGSTIRSVRSVVGALTIESFEGGTILHSDELRMSFSLDSDEKGLYDSGGDLKAVAELPGEIQIQSVWVY